MEIDFGQCLYNLDGNEIVDDGNTLTLLDIATRAIVAAPSNTPETSLRLAIRLRDGEWSLSVEEIVLLKQLIKQSYSALVAGQAVAILEGAQNPLCKV